MSAQSFLMCVTTPVVWVLHLAVLGWSKWLNLRFPHDLLTRYRDIMGGVPFGAVDSIYRHPEVLESLYRAPSSVDRWAAEQLRRALGVQKELKGSGLRVAVVGIGSGKVCREIAREFPDAEIVAMDVLREPAERLAKSPERPPNIHVVVASGTDTHLPSHSFDALVISPGIVRYFNREQRDKITLEAQRILKDSGVFIVFEGLHRGRIQAFEESLDERGWTVTRVEETLPGNFRNTIFLLAWTLYQRKLMRRLIDTVSRLRKQDHVDVLIRIAGHRKAPLFALRARPPSA